MTPSGANMGPSALLEQLVKSKKRVLANKGEKILQFMVRNV